MGKRKTIVCLETGKQFNSTEDAANAIGVSSGFISRQIKAGKPIKGFYYYYAGEMLPDEYRQKIRNRKKKPNYKSRPVICLETGERFESISLVISIIGRDGSVLLDERFRPTVKTEWPHASAVNGIYPEDVADLPTIETAIPRLREIFAGADEIIGYNVGFDLGFLSAVGVRPREDARITDTMNEFTWFMGRRYKLVDAADHIGYEWTGRAHGSLADALATLAVQRWLEQWLVAE